METTVFDITSDVARALGPGWQAALFDAGSDVSSRAWLYGPDGAVLAVFTEGACAADRRRLHIVGWAPSWLAEHFPRSSVSRISVARSKTPQVIARDVTRRLLPPYRAALETAQACQSEHEAARAACEELTAQLSEILGARRLTHAPDRVRFGRVDDGISGEIRLPSRGDATATVRVPPTHLLTLARALQQLTATDSGNH